jgi:hypothetical protein
VIDKLLIGVKSRCATFAFSFDTSMAIAIFFGNKLLALNAPLVVISMIVCAYSYAINKVIMALLDIPEKWG